MIESHYASLMPKGQKWCRQKVSDVLRKKAMIAPSNITEQKGRRHLRTAYVDET